MKPKKCRSCGELFLPTYMSTQVVCSVRCAILNTDKTKRVEWQRRKKVLKDELVTVQDLMKLAQQVFNKYIRLRDKGKPCISCLKPLGNKYDCGHFYSAGGHYSVRFDERNCAAQCVTCNQHKHGNLLMYRENLLTKLGNEEFERLSAEAMKTRKYTREELKEIIEIYKKKIKDVEK